MAGSSHRSEPVKLVTDGITIMASFEVADRLLKHNDLGLKLADEEWEKIDRAFRE